MEKTVIEAQDLTKHFPIKLGFFKTLFTKEAPVVHAVDYINFVIREKEIFGLVGESGCGKTTTGRLLIRLIEPTAGKVIFKSLDLTSLSYDQMTELRRKMQIIFQDPYESLNPRMSVYDTIAEPLRIQNVFETEEEVENRINEVMEDVHMTPPEEYIYRFPHELSGGQRQRIAVARAFALNPEFMVADEPVSMLDASTRTEVTHLILEMVKKFGVSFLYITHDIALTRYICDRIAVMYLGKIVEKGPTEETLQTPSHPYTEALIAAVPVPDPAARRAKVVIKGEVPSGVNPPSGCRFHPRCIYAKEICRKKEPPLVQIGKNRYVACHFPLEK